MLALTRSRIDSFEPCGYREFARDIQAYQKRPLILLKTDSVEYNIWLEPRASIGFQDPLGQQTNNTRIDQKKGPVLRRGLEGIPEPEGFERTRGDNW
jgi:hypothetical protein